jgi:hypothetical protein
MFSVNHQKFMEMDELPPESSIFLSSTFLAENVEVFKKMKLKNQA